jgi:drug/metabolite transporter (DMT)-like permease
VTQSLSALASLAMLGAVCLWSSATPVTKLAVAEIAVGEFVTLRLALAAVALWLIVAVTGAKAHLRGVGWRPLVMGLLEPGLVTLVVLLRAHHDLPVNGSVFWSLTPLLMPLLGYLVLGERLEMAVLAAAAMAFAATMLLVWGQNEHGGGSWLGDLCVAGGVIASAVNALLARRTAQAGANPLVTSCWQLTSGAMLTALLMAFFPATGAHVFDASRPALISLIYLGLVVSAGGVYILSNYALRHLPVGRVGLFSCLWAPSGPPWPRCSWATELSTLDLVALAIVVGAVLLPSVLAWSQAPPR